MNTTSVTAGAKTIKKNTNSTQNKSQTHRDKQYEVTSFLSTDCELSTETCSKNVYSLGPWSFDGRIVIKDANNKIHTIKDENELMAHSTVATRAGD